MSQEPDKLQQDNSSPVAIKWAVPESLEIPPDPLRLRIDFHHETTIMTFFNEDNIDTKMVDPLDIAHTLASELTFTTGLLPNSTLWWSNTKAGPLYAIYSEPQVRRLALQTAATKRPKRYNVPLPGLVFICQSGRPPWVFAVKKKPTKESDVVYKAPLANVYANGQTCPGSHSYPNRVADIVNSFMVSFFSATANLSGRSKKYPKNVLDMWQQLHKEKAQEYPIEDLIKQGTILDLLRMK